MRDVSESDANLIATESGYSFCTYTNTHQNNNLELKPLLIIIFL